MCLSVHIHVHLAILNLLSHQNREGISFVNSHPTPQSGHFKFLVAVRGLRQITRGYYKLPFGPEGSHILTAPRNQVLSDPTRPWGDEAPSTVADLEWGELCCWKNTLNVNILS